MKQVTLNIPDKKLPFFMELIKNLGYAKMEENNLSKEQLLDRLKSAIKELTSIQKAKPKHVQ